MHPTTARLPARSSRPISRSVLHAKYSRVNRYRFVRSSEAPQLAAFSITMLSIRQRRATMIIERERPWRTGGEIALSPCRSSIES